MTREEREETTEILKEKRFEINTRVNGETIFSKALGLAIEALEQEPCDAISRVEVLKVFDDKFLELQKAKQLPENKTAEDKQLGVNWCINAVKDLPSVNPQEPKTEWIPVSERLPEADEYIGNVAKYYLVQTEYGDMLVARYTHSGYWEQIYQLKPIGDEIVAWRPLPEKYKESEG